MIFVFIIHIYNMFDLVWFDMIRKYVNLCNSKTNFYCKSPFNDKIRDDCYDFIGKYDIYFAYYIVKLYDIENGIFPRHLYKQL